jgi:hypothetical protein
VEVAFLLQVEVILEELLLEKAILLEKEQKFLVDFLVFRFGLAQEIQNCLALVL